MTAYTCQINYWAEGNLFQNQNSIRISGNSTDMKGNGGEYPENKSWNTRCRDVRFWKEDQGLHV